MLLVNGEQTCSPSFHYPLDVLVSSKSLSRSEVESIAYAEEVEVPAGVDPSLMVVNHDVNLTDHLELVALHHDRRVFVDSDSQEFRSGLDNLEEVEMSVAT